MLELKHITKSYDGVTILKDIDLEINDGEIVSILGPSGCGKTTLSRRTADGSFLTAKTSQMSQWKKEALISFFRTTPFFLI